jgi:hypothetical protein
MSKKLEIRIDRVSIPGRTPVNAAALEREVSRALAIRLGIAEAPREGRISPAAERIAGAIARSLGERSPL